MAEFGWAAASTVERASAPSTAGTGCRIEELPVPQLLQVMARRGRWADCAARAAAHFGAEPPARPGTVATGSATLIWSGPDQFLVLALSREADAEAQLRERLGDAASISDQSDARAHFRLSGPRARDALAKLSSVDFHADAFAPGALAQTAVDHTNVSLWRDGEDRFNMLVFSSFADSIWHAVSEAAAEFRH